MAKYGWDDFKLEVDLVGGALQDMSSYLIDCDGCDREALTEDATVATTTAIAHLFTGLTETKETKAVFFYDDTGVTGPDVVCGAAVIGSVRSLKFTWGGTKTTIVEAIIKAASRKPRKGELTKLEVTFLPTGVVAEA